MQPATRKLPVGFEACDKFTAHGDGEVMDLPAVKHWPGLKMTRRLNWAVCALHCGDEELGSTAGVFDLLWAALGANGQRNLSVRKGANGQLSALIFKRDQAEPDLGAIALQVKVASLSEIAKLGKGPSGSASIAKYVRAWFATAQEHTSNFRCLPLGEQRVEVQEAYERAMQMDEDEVALEQWQAQGLRHDQRDSFQKAICYGRGPLNTLRKLGKKRASKEQREAGIVFRAGVSATQLIYPQDVPKLAAKKGRTYDPRSQKNIFPAATTTYTRRCTSRRCWCCGALVGTAKRHRPRQLQIAWPLAMDAIST